MFCGRRLRLGLRPTTPQNAAGTRVDPPPSPESAAGTRPAATAAADPPLDPPGENSGFHGLRVIPKRSLSQEVVIASSGIAVRPSCTNPAFKAAVTRRSVVVAGVSSMASEPR